MASGHYTYLDALIPPGTEVAASSQKLVTALVVAGGLIVLGHILTRKLRATSVASGGVASGDGVESAIIPPAKANAFGFFDLFTEVFVKYHDSVVGKENRKHLPLCASIFLFIFLSNLIGLIPGMPALTTSVWINVAMALVVFFYFNIHGVMSNGLGYFKHFLGPVWWLIPLMLPLEIFSVCLRVVTLNLRLYWNVTADHLVLGAFTDLLWPPFAVPFYFLGTFVSFMQAFIFTTLTMIYILLAVQHDEDH